MKAVARLRSEHTLGGSAYQIIALVMHMSDVDPLICTDMISERLADEKDQRVVSR